jgi:hypothetical protein
MSEYKQLDLFAIPSKECNKCHEIKPLSEFYTARACKDGLMKECKECNKAKVKKYQTDTGYEKKRNRYNIKRIFRQRYNGMKKRVKGGNGGRSSAKGRELLSLEDFLGWCHREDVYKEFMKLYNEWMSEEFPLFLAPTIDRINSDKGYMIDNIQWLSQSANSRKFKK